MPEQVEPKYKGGARSFNTARIDDSFQINLNIKWLIQLICGISLLTYSYFRLETKLEEIERNLLTAQEQLSDMIEKHKIEDELKVKKMEEQLQWFQKELDLNPMSWLRKGKKKK
tara:strand:+ start:363 stop:704 length:342 start_codon:yes stop_codon:yes gene_type:complete